MSTGGGGSQSSSTATNTTTVNVSTSVPINVDTAPLQQALQALSGVVAQGQAVTAASVAAVGRLAQQEQAQAAAASHTQLFIAALGIIAALIVARVIKVRL